VATLALGWLAISTPAAGGREAPQEAAATEKFGESVQGRALRVHRSGDAQAALQVLVVGSIHGDETQGRHVVDALRRRSDRSLERIDLWTVSAVNPDGVADRRRTNAHGVDLNRNFSHEFNAGLSGGNESGRGPFSEPETRAVARLSKEARFDVAVWYHQPLNATLVPCNASGDVARRYARLSGLPTRSGCDGYSPGSAINWQYHRFDTAAFVVELPDRALRAGEVRRHTNAVVRLARSERPD
jgi:protein MpaA